MSNKAVIATTMLLSLTLISLFAGMIATAQGMLLGREGVFSNFDAYADFVAKNILIMFLFAAVVYVFGNYLARKGYFISHLVLAVFALCVDLFFSYRLVSLYEYADFVNVLSVYASNLALIAIPLGLSIIRITPKMHKTDTLTKEN